MGWNFFVNGLQFIVKNGSILGVASALTALISSLEQVSVLFTLVNNKYRPAVSYNVRAAISRNSPQRLHVIQACIKNLVKYLRQSNSQRKTNGLKLLSNSTKYLRCFLFHWILNSLLKNMVIREIKPNQFHVQVERIRNFRFLVLHL